MIRTFFAYHVAWIIFCCIIGHSDCWGVSKPIPKEIFFSISAKEEPLGSLLEKISLATAYQIAISREWSGYPVTISLKNTTLHDALRRVLANLNNAIVIDETDRNVTIIIFDHQKEKKSLQKSMIRFGGNIPAVQKREDLFESGKNEPLLVEPPIKDEELFQKPTQNIFEDDSKTSSNGEPSQEVEVDGQPSEPSDEEIPPEDLFKRD